MIMNDDKGVISFYGNCYYGLRLYCFMESKLIIINDNESFLLKTGSSLSDDILIFAEGKSDKSLSQVTVTSIIERWHGDADNFVLIDELVGKGIVFCQLVSVLVFVVLVFDLNSWDISQDEASSLRNPEAVVEWGFQKFFNQNISAIF